MKVRSDHRNKFSNLSNWKEEAWKYKGFNGIRTRDLRDNGAMLNQLSCEATQIDLAPNVWLHSSVGRASHRYRGGHGLESRWSPDVFQASSFQTLTLKLENLLRWSLFTFSILIDW